jgi:hypothetical protein
VRREFERAGLGYVLRVPELMTELGLDRITRSRGETHGELVVLCGLPGTRSADGHIHQARFNLTSTSARTTTAKVLAQRANAPEVDWLDLLEDLCRRVLAAERAGTPTVVVGGLPHQLGIAWTLEPIIAAGKATILYGEGGTGKSTLAVAAALSVQTGAEIVPGWSPRQAGVLYLDWETDAPDVDGKVKMLAAGAGIRPPFGLRYREMVGPLADQVESIAAEIAEHDVALLVVDSIGLASGTTSDGSDASESALRLFSAFRALRVAVLAVDHVSKSGADEAHRTTRPYGSIYKVNLARATIELRRDESGGERSKVGIYNTKTNLGRRLAPQALWVEHGESAIRYTRADLDGRLEEALPLVERIARTLVLAPGGAMTVAAIAEAVGTEENTVRATLSRYRTRFVKNEITKVWAVRAAERGVG